MDLLFLPTRITRLLSLRSTAIPWRSSQLIFSRPRSAILQFDLLALIAYRMCLCACRCVERRHLQRGQRRNGDREGHRDVLHVWTSPGPLYWKGETWLMAFEFDAHNHAFMYRPVSCTPKKETENTTHLLVLFKVLYLSTSVPQTICCWGTLSDLSILSLRSHIYVWRFGVLAVTNNTLQCIVHQVFRDDSCFVHTGAVQGWAGGLLPPKFVLLLILS